MALPEHCMSKQSNTHELDSGFVCEMVGEQPPITSPSDSHVAISSSSLEDEITERMSPSVQDVAVPATTPQVKQVGIKLMKSGRWQAQIKIRRKFFYLGTFDTAEEALSARCRKRLEFGSTDFPEKKKKQKTERSDVRLEKDGISAHRCVRYAVSPNLRLEMVCSSLEDAVKGEITSQNFLIGEVMNGPRKLPPGVRKSVSGRRWEAYVYDPMRKGNIYLGSYATAENALAAYDRKKLEFGSKSFQLVKKKKKKKKKWNHSKRRSLLINSKFGSKLVKEQSLALVEDPHLVASRGENKASSQKPTCHPQSEQGFTVATSTNCIERKSNQTEDEIDPELLLEQKSEQLDVDFEENNAQQFVRYALKPDPSFKALFSSSIQKDEAVKGETISSRKQAATQVAVSSVVNCATKSPLGVRVRPTRSGHRWEAYIHDPIKKKKAYLGSYATAEEAVEARRKKRLEFELICPGRKKKIKGSNVSVTQEKSSLTTEIDDLIQKANALLINSDRAEKDADALDRKRGEFELMVHLNESRSKLKDHSEFERFECGLGYVYQASDFQNGTSTIALSQVLEKEQHGKVSNIDLGDMRIPFRAFTDEGEFDDSGVINSYGQLVGEYSRLDDELWFCGSKKDDGDE